MSGISHVKCYIYAVSRFLVILVCCVICAAPAWADDGQAIKSLSTINFLSFSDPGYLTFETPEGKQSSADFFYATIQYGDIKNWKSGEKLNIVIDEKNGAGIIRINTGQFYKLFFHSDWHPINIASQTCLDGAETTIAINKCYSVNAGQWQTEQKAALEQAGKILQSEHDADILRATQADWDGYNEKMNQAFKNYASEKDGTIWSTLTIKQRANLERSRYFEIMDFMDSD